MYARFTLSLRDVEELLAERGSDISYETVRRWFLKFGQVYHTDLQDRRTIQAGPGAYVASGPCLTGATGGARCNRNDEA